jgi:hypothetical protein
VPQTVSKKPIEQRTPAHAHHLPTVHQEAHDYHDFEHHEDH